MPQRQLQNLEALLLEVGSGNEVAFGELLNFYEGQINNYIFRFTRSQSLTEEIVQDVFLKIWLNRNNLIKIHCFESYLFATARNHTFDCLKQINRKKKKEKEWLNSIINQGIIEMQESLIEKSYEKIEAAVKLLPCQQKKVYLLRNKGLKRVEIARKLNISVETVKKHSMLTKRFLKKRLIENMKIKV